MSTFSDIRHQIRQLTFAEQLRLLEELAIVVRQQVEARPKRSILELKSRYNSKGDRFFTLHFQDLYLGLRQHEFYEFWVSFLQFTQSASSLSPSNL